MSLLCIIFNPSFLNIVESFDCSDYIKLSLLIKLTFVKS